MPTLQRAPLDTQRLAQAGNAFGLQAMHPSRNQHHDQSGLNPAPHETNQLGRSSPATTFPGATETVAIIPLRPAAGLAVVIGPVQLASAKEAALLVRLLGQIPIDFLQQLV
jgi:hypothetical protein